METSGAEAGSAAWRLVRSAPALFAAALAALALLFSVDLAGGQDIRIAGVMIVVPALSAVFLPPLPVVALSVLTIPAVIVASIDNKSIDTENFPVVMATTVLVGVTSVMAARLRRRRERELARVRRVAEVTQRALLRPLPPRLGRMTISSMYLAADEEAAIGGDLYAAGINDCGGARFLVGDVQGKGLAAVEVASMLLNAFRRSVRARVSLQALPGYLDRGLRADLEDLEELEEEENGSAPADTTFAERFVTAVMVDVAQDGSSVRVANCGHPPPLLIRGDTVRTLESEVPGLPLGLGDLSRSDEHIDSHDLEVGDILLLYTDGVIESRDAAGEFYPLADRLAAWTRDTPAVLLEEIRADLLVHAADGLGDDIAMVALERVD